MLTGGLSVARQPEGDAPSEWVVVVAELVTRVQVRVSQLLDLLACCLHVARKPQHFTFDCRNDALITLVAIQHARDARVIREQVDVLPARDPQLPLDLERVLIEPMQHVPHLRLG